MENAGSNTTSFSNDTLFSIEYNITEFNSTIDNLMKQDVTIWNIAQCIEAELINNTKVDFSNIFFSINNTQVRCLEHAPVLNMSTVIRASILFTMAVLSLIGNVATMISIKQRKRRRGRARPSWTAIYSLIFQLSIADLLVTIFCIGGEAAWSFTVQWYAGNLGCKFFKFMQMFALYLSTFILVLIGVDRWLAVKYPMKSMGTATRSGRLVLVAWFLSVVLSIPQAVVFRVAKGPHIEEFYQCVTHGFYSEPWQEQVYTTISLVVMFILPLLILISTYVSTVHTIAQSEKVFKPEVSKQEKYITPDQNRRRLIDRAKMKSLRMSIVIVAAFIICWTPYYVMMIIFMFHNPDKKQIADLLEAIFFFGMSNSLINPVIYGAFHLWPKKKVSRHSDRESGGYAASMYTRRGEHTSSIRLTTIRSIRSSVKDYNGHNCNAVVFRVAKGPHIEEFYQCVTHGFYSEPWQEQVYTTISLVVMFILPLLILISMYVSTVHTIAQSEKVFKPEVSKQEKYITPDQNRRRLIDRAKMKSLRMSIVIVAAFIICWTPYYVMMIIFMFHNPDKKQIADLLEAIFFFGMSNSLINPVIYGAFHLWPKKKVSRHSDRESGGYAASMYTRRGEHTSSIRLTTIRSIRSSVKDYNGHNCNASLL